MTDKEELAKFVAERNRAAMGTLQDWKDYANKRNVKFTSDKPLEISYHKCRTAIMALPGNIRMQSHEWLITRGYESWL